MLLREPPFLAGRIFTQPQVHHFSSALHGPSFVFPRTVSYYPSFLPSERLRGGGARGGESGHAADGEGEPEAPLEQDGAGGRAEEEKEGVRPYVGLKRGYAALCPYHLLGRRELSCERVGRRNGRTPACESAKFLDRKIYVREGSADEMRVSLKRTRVECLPCAACGSVGLRACQLI